MSDQIADVAIIGGGVVGTAIFRQLVLNGYRVILLEKNSHLAQGASSGNSGIACTGYDAPEGSLERQCIRRSLQLNPAVYAELGLPFRRTGSLVIAWTTEEYAKLPHIVEANHALGRLTNSIIHERRYVQILGIILRYICE
jgi:glycerol-3-phosphate dehydrogenase